jgi:site-specific DNA recombinase
MGRRTLTKTVATIAEHGVRVAIYVRRSTDEEHQPFSIEAQDSRLGVLREVAARLESGRSVRG